ncbi:MAG: pantetheine-phosphate adenylyltransferase [Cyanobacteria bacterium SIG30]|nr:pantetheine-phosphate adenylyltransferase [Cyanobacteria bacterium SIG30]
MAKEEKIAIYPGSFDPITKGHLDVLSKASSMFDKVIIAVLKNSSKKSFLPVEDRVILIKECIKNMENVEVTSFSGLTVECAEKNNAQFIIRGLRAVSDFEYEMQLSQTNSALKSDICTVFLTTRPKYNFISSSIVKEISQFGGDVSKFVPEVVVEYLKEKQK